MRPSVAKRRYRSNGGCRRHSFPSLAPGGAAEEGRMLLVNVYDGLGPLAPGTIRRLRLVGVPPKTQPNMNQPVMGVTARDPGKFVLGTVPVEKDGSAWFRARRRVPVLPGIRRAGDRRADDAQRRLRPAGRTVPAWAATSREHRVRRPPHSP